MPLLARQRTANLRDAAVGAGLTLATVLAPNAAGSAEVAKATAAVPKPSATLDAEVCSRAAGNAEFIVEHATNHRKLPPSRTLLNSMADWLDAKCKTPFEIQWETKNDWEIFTVIRSQMLGLKTPVSLENAGVKLAPRPTLRPPKPVASAATKG